MPENPAQKGVFLLMKGTVDRIEETFAVCEMDGRIMQNIPLSAFTEQPKDGDIFDFENGIAVSYTCKNFETEEENKALVKQMILKNHETLPMGEFAIGTNTTAYEVALRYGILDKFPILIAEKMGPHFAVGDTCYSWMEDCPVFNPDGREMVARENEISAKRKENPQEAYFGCHTDITIPYSELDTIEAIHPDGTSVKIIAGGRFALPGTEKLNEPLEK